MKRIYNIIIALLAISLSAMGQTLIVEPIEVEAGGEATLTMNLSGGTGKTALQFNLTLPEGITLTGCCQTGAAVNGHTLSVQSLDNGDHLFILYSMDLNRFKDGELLRIPVSIGNNANRGEGRLYNFRTATTDVMSYASADVRFTINVTAAASQKCATPVLTYQNGKVRCTCETEDVTYVYTITPAGSTGESSDGVISLGTTFTVNVKATRDGYTDSDIATTTINLAAVGDVNGDGQVNINDVTTLVNIILGR